MERRLKFKTRLKKLFEYVVAWVCIILVVAVTLLPVQYLATKYYFTKIQDKQKTHVTILIGGEKITLENVDVVHVEEE